LFLSAKLLYGFLCFFKREAALWIPVVFKREAALWITVFLSAKLLYGFLCFFIKREAALWIPVFIFIFFICNGHCCQTQAKKCQFKGKVTFRSIRF